MWEEIPRKPLLPQWVLRYSAAMEAPSVAGHDPVLEALTAVVADLNANVESSRAAIARARRMQELKGRGLTHREIVEKTGGPLVVELITDNIDRLTGSGAQLRQAQARALHAEGMTMQQVADLFGVTRQRISALIRAAQT